MIMPLDKLNKRLLDIKEKLKKIFKNQGFNDDQIQIRMDSIDTEFLVHAFVNGKFIKESTTEERLEFYIRYLEIKFQELK